MYDCDLDDTLLECLTNFGKENAVLYMLQNEVIRAKMKEYVIWTKVLQHGLDYIACTKKTDIVFVTAFIEAPRKAEDTKLEGTIALMNVLKLSDVECAVLLLQKTSVIPNYKDKNDEGYVHYLVNSEIKNADFEKICDLLMEHGVDMNLVDHCGDTPLLVCIRSACNLTNSLGNLKCLVKNGADINARNTQNGLGCLHQIVASELTTDVFKETIESLVLLGADIILKNAHGQSSLYMFINRIISTSEGPDNYRDMIKFLVNVGADVDTIDDENGLGCLHILTTAKMTYEKFESVCDTLLFCDANIELTSMQGYTALYHCMYKAENRDTCVDRCIYLINRGADILRRDSFGRNALLIALKTYTPITCEILSEYMLNDWDNFSDADEQGKTAMDYILENRPDTNCFEFLQYLAQAGVPAFHKDKYGAVPLMLALKNEFDIDCIRYLSEDSPS